MSTENNGKQNPQDIAIHVEQTEEKINVSPSPAVQNDSPTVENGEVARHHPPEIRPTHLAQTEEKINVSPAPNVQNDSPTIENGEVARHHSPEIRPTHLAQTEEKINVSPSPAVQNDSPTIENGEAVRHHSPEIRPTHLAQTEEKINVPPTPNVQNDSPAVENGEVARRHHLPEIDIPPKKAVRPIPLTGSNAPQRNVRNVSVVLPNGRQNQHYQVDLSNLPQFRDLSSCNICDDQNTGLKLCPNTFVLSGVIPQEIVDKCQLVFCGKDFNQVAVRITAILIVNPDPKTLWKEVEPSSPFFRKPHRHFERKEGKYGVLTAARIRGRSHAQRGDFCEDDFSVMLQEEIGYFGMVSDGAGSAKFSRLGSRLLAENLPRFLHHFIYQQLSSNDLFRRWENLLLGSSNERNRALQIMKSIFTNALRHSAHTLHQHTLISLKDAETKEDVAIRFRDLYSTCLAFWAYPLKEGKYWALVSYWVGDGALAVEHDGKFSLLGLPDGGEFSGQTRFFADEELTDAALEKRLWANIYQNLQSVWAFSDGITDAKFASEKQLGKSETWQELTAEIVPNLIEEQKIFSWLEFWAQGEHDDRSLCVFEVKGNNNE